jgi:nucleoside-diphosphate-sugar epimerase
LLWLPPNPPGVPAGTKFLTSCTPIRPRQSIAAWWVSTISIPTTTRPLSGRWQFHQLDIADAAAMAELFAAVRPRRVIHLAAQAGVRYSLENPATHIKSNLVGIEHLVYASSRSVYGGNSNLPFQERQPVNHPVSLNAATKKGGELRPTPTATCMGCRPDMAPMLFAKAILAGEPIRVFNQGRMRRDFTYIDDIVEGVVRCLDKPIPPPAGRRIGCSTLAMPRARSCWISSACWSGPWAARRASSLNRCSPVRWRPPPPTPRR